MEKIACRKGEKKNRGRSLIHIAKTWQNGGKNRHRMNRGGKGQSHLWLMTGLFATIRVIGGDAE